MTEKEVLIHCCCAHCAAYTVEHWRRQGYKSHLYWYNPNIHPFTEYKKRLESMIILAWRCNSPLVVNDSYDMASYFNSIIGHETERCRYCFEMRLRKTAEVAKQNNFNYFTTTLLISPHQKHTLVKEIGHKVANETGNSFLYADLRKRYSESRHITKPMELYRQQYCGCVYSKWERFFESKKS